MRSIKVQFYHNCYYEKIGKSEPVKLEDLPFDIPDSWTWVRHNSIFEIFGGSQPPKDKFIGYPKEGYIRLYQIRDYGPKPEPVYIPIKDAHKVTVKGDILLARYGASVGKVFFAEDGAYNVAMAKVEKLYVNDYIDKMFLYTFYKSSLYQSLVLNNSRSAQAGFNKEDLNSLLIPLPPLEEQIRIVEKINSFEPLIAQYSIAEERMSILEEEFPEKLKKSILQYAIEGKLVKQDPNDEPASVLLERIKAEKERLIKEGKIKRDKNESYIYQGDDKNYYENLPESYVVTYLSSAGNWRSGATPQRGNSDYYGGNIPWIKTGELNNATIYDSVEKVTKVALSKCSLPINDIGNVLIAMYGATIGKLAIAGIPLTTNQACCGCKPFSGIDNKYLFYYLMANKQRFIDSAEGGAQPNISREKIIAYPFILPPYNEQIRISRKLDFILNQISC